MHKTGISNEPKIENNQKNLSKRTYIRSPNKMAGSFSKTIATTEIDSTTGSGGVAIP